MADEPGTQPNATLKINEVYQSLQGESTWAGRPCVFIRLTGCHLRCGYCDTEYAFYEGKRRSVDDIVEQTRQFDCDLAEVTGGEPLLQPAVHELMAKLCDSGMTVLLETSGACDISPCDTRVIRIMDIKTPSSGEAGKTHWPNLDHLTKRDEVKFVIGDEADYRWAHAIIQKHDLCSRVGAVLLSPVTAMDPDDDSELAGATALPPADLAKWVLDDNLPVRLQTQMHKLIWDPKTRGV